MTELKDGDYVITKLEDGKYHARIVGDNMTDLQAVGDFPIDALRRLNTIGWNIVHERQIRLDRCMDRLTFTIRVAAGVPKFMAGWPKFFLFGLKKKERDEQYDRMAEILTRVEAEHGDLIWEQRTDLCIWEFNSARPS